MQTFRRRLSFSDELEVPSTLEVLLFFYRLSIYKSLVRHKNMTALHDAATSTGTLIRIVSQMVLKDFSALCCLSQLSPLSKVIVPYTIFDQQLVRRTVVSLRMNFFAPITQGKSLEDVIGALFRANRIDSEAHG